MILLMPPSSSNSKPLPLEQYTVGWISALPIELAAATAMLDEEHGSPPSDHNDPTIYTLGRIAGHAVVMGCLPAGRQGSTPAATIATRMMARFPSMRFGLLVGVGGGVPTEIDDIRLGDVVVSQPDGQHGGVVQFNMGEEGPNGFKRTGHLNAPPEMLLSALSTLQARYYSGRSHHLDHLAAIQHSRFSRANAGLDQLFQLTPEAVVEANSGSNAPSFDKQVERPTRDVNELVQIHYGTIASDNKAIRNARVRDLLVQQLGDRVLCFDMEAAGLMNYFPCLVIRGIYNYSDSHQYDRWQPYAAATAAAYAKELLSVIPIENVTKLQTVQVSWLLLIARPEGPADTFQQISAEFSGQLNRGLQVAMNPGVINNYNISLDRRPTPPSPSAIIPFEPDPDYVDRGDIIEQILQRHTASVTRVALVGLGGVGKSQIAIHYAHQFRKQNATHWVFWVHAGSRTRFEESYQRIAQRLNLSSQQDSQEKTLRLVFDWLSNEKNGHWLMVIDNADEYNIFFPKKTVREHQSTEAQAIGLVEFLPQGQHGRYLFTSRTRDAAVRLIGSHRGIISVPVMDYNEGRQLVNKKLEDAPGADVLPFLTALDFIPLAITQATAYIRQMGPRWSIVKYLELFSQSSDGLTRLLTKDVGDLRRLPEAQNSILRTWEISFHQIKREHPKAADLLSLMSCFHWQGIPIFAIEHYTHDGIGTDTSPRGVEWEEDVAILEAYHLITTEANGETLEMHRLVKLCTQEWLRVDGIHQHWSSQYLRLMAKEFPLGKFENWQICQKLYPHLQEVLQEKPPDKVLQIEWAQLLHNVGGYASEIGKLKEGRQYTQQAVEERTRIFGKEDARTLDSMHKLALDLRSVGKYTEAEQVLQQTLTLRKKLLGEQNPSVLVSMHEVAYTMGDQGKYVEAEKMYREVLALNEKVLGREHQNTLNSMHEVARMMGLRGKYAEAERMHREVLALKEKVLNNRDHPSLLTSRFNVAQMMGYQGHYAEAEQMYREVFTARKKVLGKNHPETLNAMHEVAVMMGYQGKYAEAEKMHREELALREKVLNNRDHPSVLTSIFNVAKMMGYQGYYAEAEQMYREVLAAGKKVLGENHPDTLTTMHEVALMMGYQEKKSAEAEELFAKVIELYEKALGREHPETLNAMSNLSSLMYRQRKYDKAEPLDREILALKQRVLGLEHPNTLTSMNNLANVLSAQGKLAEAEQMHRDVLAARERILGPKHPHTIISRENLAHVLSKQNKVDEQMEILFSNSSGTQELNGTPTQEAILTQEEVSEQEEASLSDESHGSELDIKITTPGSSQHADAPVEAPTLDLDAGPRLTLPPTDDNQHELVIEKDLKVSEDGKKRLRFRDKVFNFRLKGKGKQKETK